ncbi:690_t:CDS:2, partial [Racocetra persica]
VLGGVSDSAPFINLYAILHIVLAVLQLRLKCVGGSALFTTAENYNILFNPVISASEIASFIHISLTLIGEQINWTVLSLLLQLDISINLNMPAITIITCSGSIIMPDIFSEIPYEIVVKILTFLPAKDLCSISLVNKNLLSFTQDDYVWQSICISQFPASRISEERKKMITKEESDLDIFEESDQDFFFEESDNDIFEESDQDTFEEIIFISNLGKTTPSVENNNDVTVSEWKRLYKRLSRHINFIVEERGVTWLDCQEHGGNKHHWRTIKDSQSEFGKVVCLKYVWWFDAVLPGTYDVVWRLKIKGNNHWTIQGLNFSANVIERLEDEIDAETAIHDEKLYNHTPHRS